MKEQRKATDANGKGLEDEYSGLKKRKQPPPQKQPPPKPKGAIPKWKL